MSDSAYSIWLRVGGRLSTAQPKHSGEVMYRCYRVFHLSAAARLSAYDAMLRPWGESFPSIGILGDAILGPQSVASGLLMGLEKTCVIKYMPARVCSITLELHAQDNGQSTCTGCSEVLWNLRD